MNVSTTHNFSGMIAVDENDYVIHNSNNYLIKRNVTSKNYEIRYKIHKNLTKIIVNVIMHKKFIQ
jgi:hypothetical protein